jgi:HEAT repeat protein
MNKTRHVDVDPDPFMEQLASTDGAIREKARDSLVALGRSAVSPLIEALETSASKQMRWEAAKALCALVDARSIPVLVKSLEDGDADVGWLAAEALRAFKRRSWTPILRALIEKEGKSAALRQGAHQVFVHQTANGFDDVLARLVAALEPKAAPDSTVLAAEDVLNRLKAAS